MVLMAAASDDHRHHDRHHHHHRRRHRAAKRSPTPPPPPPQPQPESPSPPPLDCFSFTWGVRRRLRCSKDGAPVTATGLPSPPQHPATPSSDKEKPPQGDAAAGPSSRPQRSRHLRPLRYPATHPTSRSTDAGAGQALHSPASAPPPLLTEPQQPRKRGFAVALTKQEIARDFAAVRCKRPPRRGKKRSKAQQAKIDALCPGFFLSTVDLDNYKIDDNNNR